MSIIKDNLKQYQQEQNQVLEHIIFNNVYPRLKTREFKKHRQMGLEFFITSTCNKQCTYCYLQKNANKLCPPEIRDTNLIKKNLRILLNHFAKYNNGEYDKLDLFSGEIWGYQLGNEVFDILLEYMKNNKVSFEAIIIPSNCSFVADDEKCAVVEKYIKDFKEYGCRLIFSCSDDGLILDSETRPYASGSMSISAEEFYNKLWDFCGKYHYCFHPMVDAFTIEKWEDNLQWWIEQLEAHNFDFLDRCMLLEVRNPNSWTDEKIISYLKFVKKLTEYVYNREDYYNKDKIKFVKDTCGLVPDDESVMKKSSYFAWSMRENTRASCSITQSLNIRVGDLMIIPCHRTAYSKFNYGQYIVENDEIIGIEANNISNAISHLITGTGSYLKCDSCVFSKYCVKGCHGAQFEYSKEMFYPIPSVCELEKAKVLYTLINMQNILNSISDLSCKSIAYNINTELKFIKDNEREVYTKWAPIVQSLLLDV